MHLGSTNNILLVFLLRGGSKSEDSRDGRRPSIRKRSPIERLAFTELYLREVFGQSNLVETRGRKKRQNLSNNLKKTRRQKQKTLWRYYHRKTRQTVLLVESAQHSPQKPKRRRAEKNKWRAIKEKIQNDIVAKIANKPTCKRVLATPIGSSAPPRLQTTSYRPTQGEYQGQSHVRDDRSYVRSPYILQVCIQQVCKLPRG